MKAEFKASYDHNRVRLREHLPLCAPFTIYIEPTKACNFRCFYCMHSTRNEAGGIFEQTGYHPIHMPAELYSKLVQDILDLPTAPKRIVFSGLGEPLCNPHLPQMIAALRSAGFAGRIDIITNGALLTHKLSEELIFAGVSRIQVSVQGLDSDGYQKVCGVRINFEEYIEQLHYLYNHRRSAQVFIKIIDALLETSDAEKRFFSFFGNICDSIFIEHLIVLQQQMGDHGGRVDPTRNFNNEPIRFRNVCPVITYHLQISVEGHTFPCPVSGLMSNFSLGNANEHSLVDIWNGRRRIGLIRAQLMNKRCQMDICKDCTACASVLDPNEDLDDCAEELIIRYPLP